MLAFFSVVAGIGNGVFHPVDYTLLNRKVHATRLGHAFSVHGITGSLGWALAPAMLVPIDAGVLVARRAGSAGVLALVVLVVLVAEPRAAGARDAQRGRAGRRAPRAPAREGSFGFLTHPGGLDVLRASSSSTRS